mmetsp:Transcript_15507/g.17360  ORF Transcript_15507/g.17360 Transcript_15507/m.17360 type:complete len:96 (+) Transcript_15507:354-641(+)
MYCVLVGHPLSCGSQAGMFKSTQSDTKSGSLSLQRRLRLVNSLQLKVPASMTSTGDSSEFAIDANGEEEKDDSPPLMNVIVAIASKMAPTRKRFL